MTLSIIWQVQKRLDLVINVAKPVHGFKDLKDPVKPIRVCPEVVLIKLKGAW